MENGLFLIGDPARGEQHWTEAQLVSAWKSGACLVLTPAAHFVKVQEQNHQKKHWFLDQILARTCPCLLFAR